MEIQLLENETREVAESVQRICEDAEDIRIAVAFARASGLDALPVTDLARRNGATLRFLAGVDFQLTDLAIIEKIHRPPHFEGRLFWTETSESRCFHPKVYIAGTKDEIRAVVGSSNFTGGGLRKNEEANLLIRAPRQHPVALELLEFHARLWDSPLSVPVTAEIREQYSRLQDRRHRAESQLRREPHFEKFQKQMALAVSDAIASWAGPRGKHTWLMITSPENYILCQQKHIWGDEREARISRIQPGDILFFYVSKLHQLKMMALAGGPIYRDDEPYWEDRKYPYRLPFLPLAEPVVHLPLKPLVGELELFRGIDPVHWGQKLQHSQLLLSPKDADLIRQAIIAASGLKETA